METRVDTLLSQLYEIEGIMLVMQRRHDELPPQLLSMLEVKLNALRKQAGDLEKELASRTANAGPEPAAAAPSPAIEPEPVAGVNPEPVTKPEHKHATEPQLKAPVAPPAARVAAAAVGPKPARDIMTAFSINDRFLFLRELFDGDEQRFNDTIAHMQHMSSIDQVHNFMTHILNWDPSNDVVKEFSRIVGTCYK